MSMQDQGGGQEPESPDQPQEPTPGEPGTMPDEPLPAPEAPDMPADPDRELDCDLDIRPQPTQTEVKRGGASPFRAVQ